MSKRYFGYKALLMVLRGLVYVKRGLFVVLEVVWSGVQFGYGLYKKTLGLYVYKVSFYIQKFFRKYFFSHKYTRLELLSQRGVLQVGLFFVVLVVMIPQSKLYTKELDQLPGRQTLLYQLVAPEELGTDIEELDANINLELVESAPAWKAGTVEAQPQTGESAVSDVPQELAGLSPGGSALVKPIIAPGADVESLAADAAASGKRSKVVVYEVKSGDVVGNIAKKYGIDVTTILWANGLSTRSYIRPGDELKILPTSGVLHKVKSGDTISKLARTYKAEADSIVTFNKLKEDGSDIVIGEELVIPGGTKKSAPVRRVARKTSQSNKFQNVVAPPSSIATPAGSGYVWPTAASIITQYYGWRHTGLDVAAKMGTPIYAARGGRVTKSKCGWNGGYGCYIVIDHGNGVQTLYAHNSRMYVSAGETVRQGQTIALMGSTGRSTGPHLHFEVKVNGRKVNPLSYVRR